MKSWFLGGKTSKHLQDVIFILHRLRSSLCLVNLDKQLCFALHNREKAHGGFYFPVDLLGVSTLAAAI